MESTIPCLYQVLAVTAARFVAFRSFSFNSNFSDRYAYFC